MEFMGFSQGVAGLSCPIPRQHQDFEFVLDEGRGLHVV